MNGTKSAGGIGIAAAVAFAALIAVLLYKSGDGALSSAIKFVIIAAAVIAGLIVIAVVVAIIFVRKDEKDKRDAEILSKPLEKFSDSDTAELERKYGAEPVGPADPPASGPHTTNSSSSRRFSREEYEKQFRNK